MINIDGRFAESRQAASENRDDQRNQGRMIEVGRKSGNQTFREVLLDKIDGNVKNNINRWY